MSLIEYRKKRHFAKSPEPKGKRHASASQLQFVIQKHAARRLHYDFRLESDGVLKSWAVPKGPSLDPSVKSLAVEVEDHPLEYASFEGVIPQGQYGGGTVLLWDRGTWEPDGDAKKMFQQGKLTFALEGKKLKGHWALIRMHRSTEKERPNWLLKKVNDPFARRLSDYDVLESQPKSVATHRTMEKIASAADRVWNSSREHARESQSGKGSRRRRKKPAPRKATRGDLDVSKISGARRGLPPKKFRPQLATLVQSVPEGDDWLHEIKLDGYRLLCVFDKGKPRLLTRKGSDWTNRFPTVVAAAQKLGLRHTILDGEIVVLASDGTSDFQSLQNLMQRERDDDVVYFVFDLPYFHRYDLTHATLVERKRLLKKIIGSSRAAGVIRFSDHIVGDGREVLEVSCQRSLEGIISKRSDSPYEQRRSQNWVKVKCHKRQEFVVGGWSDPSGARAGFGALLLGYHNELGRLTYCGRVGTGFKKKSLQQIKHQLDKLATTEPPFDKPPHGYAARGSHWVQPRLIAEVEFAQWTNEGMLRQPVFLGLREDKSPREVTREQPMDIGGGTRKRSTKRTGTRKTRRRS